MNLISTIFLPCLASARTVYKTGKLGIEYRVTCFSLVLYPVEMFKLIAYCCFMLLFCFFTILIKMFINSYIELLHILKAFPFLFWTVMNIWMKINKYDLINKIKFYVLLPRTWIFLSILYLHDWYKSSDVFVCVLGFSDSHSQYKFSIYYYI